MGKLLVLPQRQTLERNIAGWRALYLDETQKAKQLRQLVEQQRRKIKKQTAIIWLLVSVCVCLFIIATY